MIRHVYDCLWHEADHLDGLLSLQQMTLNGHLPLIGRLQPPSFHASHSGQITLR